MIIVRAPLRITLGGGGTDLPDYTNTHGGFCVSAAIDKYVYVAVTRPFRKGIYLKYSEIEHVDAAEKVTHPGFRKYLMGCAPAVEQFEAVTLADIPSGTGLGSSGAFAAALVRAGHPDSLATQIIAERAYRLEDESAGRQDPYIAAYGGVRALEFSTHLATVTAFDVPRDTLATLEDNLLLFFTGFTRSASDALQGQARATMNLHRVKKNGLASYEALKAGDLDCFAALMNEQWELKAERIPPDPRIARWRDWGLEAGAQAAKLVGAGGGGFLLFYAESKKKLREVMSEAGLPETRFRFDTEGVKVMVSE